MSEPTCSECRWFDWEVIDWAHNLEHWCTKNHPEFETIDGWKDEKGLARVASNCPDYEPEDLD